MEPRSRRVRNWTERRQPPNGISAIMISSRAALADRLSSNAQRAGPADHDLAARTGPSFVLRQAFLENEGAGNAGCRPHPWPACNKKNQAARATARLSRREREPLA